MVVVPEPAVKGGGAVLARAVDGAVGPAGEEGADEALDSPMSSVECWGGFRPGVEAAVDDVCEVSFERAARFAWCLAFGDFAGEIGAGWWVVAGLDDGDAVKGGVELAVAAAVEPVAAGGLARAAGDGCGAAEAGEGGGVAEAADVAGVGDHGGGDLRPGAVQVADGVAVLGEELRDLGIEGG